ncbi:MAG TPA: flagellar assembly protein FliX [Pseudolabrys sp.]|nr:flagellar assembly protein FliX [Pseudolabrys sp.]
MRINATQGAKVASAPTSARRAGGGTFTVSEQETPRETTGASALRSVSSLDGLIALQGIEGPAERKKRAVVRGRKALDVLDTLKLGLLDGQLDGSTLARLRVVGDGLSEETGDAGLDQVMGEINLRVEVELAKAGIR